MGYPRIHSHGGMFHLDFELPKNYEKMVECIDKKFIASLTGVSKCILEEFDAGETIYFHWDKRRGVHGIHIGTGQGALLNEGSDDEKRYVFKNLKEWNRAFAVINIITTYLNKLEEENQTSNI